MYRYYAPWIEVDDDDRLIIWIQRVDSRWRGSCTPAASGAPPPKRPRTKTATALVADNLLATVSVHKYNLVTALVGAPINGPGLTTRGPAWVPGQGRAG